MSKVYTISDLHLGHAKLAENYRGFKNVHEHNQFIIDKWNSIVNKRDIVYILGDVTLEHWIYYELLDQMIGRKVVVMGNHDKYKHVKKLLQHVEGVAGAIDYKGFILTHIPIHPIELERYRANIHGHVHMNTIDNPKYINVSAEVIDYTPVEIIKLK